MFPQLNFIELTKIRVCKSLIQHTFNIKTSEPQRKSDSLISPNHLVLLTNIKKKLDCKTIAAGCTK